MKQLRPIYALSMFLAALMLAIGGASAFAQGVTTSALTGTVTDGTDYLKQLDDALAGKMTQDAIVTKALPGSKVTAIHTPSGTQYNALVRPDGYYNLKGLRVGGPYLIVVTRIGYKKEELRNITLALGENRRLDVALTEEAAKVGEVSVTAQKISRSDSRIGAGADISTAQIEALPSISRSLQDFARTNPYAIGNNLGQGDNIGGLYIAGQNNRYNNLQVDGAVINDVFGLSSTGTPGGQAGTQPISLDAIAELQVAVAPFDIRQSGFTGGLVNSVTRSGTNQFEGSVYFYGKNQGLVGLSPDERKTKYPSFSDSWFGGRVGGPIIENTLFFFVNAESKTKSEPVELGINDPTKANNFPVSSSDLDRIISIAKTKYNYDPGTYDTFTRKQNDLKLFARVDWNISDQHHLTLRHNYNNATQDRGVDRTNIALSLSNSKYLFSSVQNNTVLQLNSSFSETMSNEFRVSYMSIKEKRGDFAGANFPYVEIGVGPNQTATMGVEAFSQANALDQSIFEITDDFTVFAGSHTLTIGTHNEFFSSANVFFPWYFGNYKYGSINDFANGTPYGYINRFSTDAAKYGVTPTANFSSAQLGFYVQDEWDVTSVLRLNLGVRGDLFILPNKPYANPVVPQAFPGYQTDAVSSGALVLSPRVGFTYDLTKGERTTVVRGGTGLFTGRPPIVWYSNQYSNTGVDVATNFIFGPSAPNSKVPGFMDWRNPPAQNKGLQPGQYQATVNMVDKDFKLPQVWRSNLAIDQKLGAGFGASAEFLYSANVNYPLYKNLRLGSSTPNKIDGRPMYAYDGGIKNTATASSLDYAFLLTNISSGYSYNATFQIGKQAGAAGNDPATVSDFVRNLGINLAYTYGASYDVNSNPGYIADENYLVPAVDPNNLPLTRSVFDIPHRLVVTASYRLEYLTSDNGSWATTISLFYEGRSGRPFSYVYNGAKNGSDVNGDRMSVYPTDNDLIFVPANRSQVSMSDAGWQAFDAYISKDETLNSNRGKIIERNSAREPWATQVDLQILQDIPTFKGQKLQLSLSVLNLLNFLNGDWGHQQFIQNPGGDFSGQTRYLLVEHNGYEADGRPKLSFTVPQSIFTKDNLLSRWQMQVGVRYTF